MSIHYDTKKHQSGLLRLYVRCPHHDGRCEKWIFRHLYDSDAHAEAWLCAWIYEGRKLRYRWQTEDHMNHEPAKEVVEAVYLGEFQGVEGATACEECPMLVGQGQG